MTDQKLIIAGQEAAGCLPMTKLSDEAVALLVACNSFVNSMALQQVDVPVRLLTDLTLFCREETGFMIPFPKLATMAVTFESESMLDQLQELAGRIDTVAKSLSINAHNAAIKLDMDHPDVPEVRNLLDGLGDLELLTHRIAEMFGWSKLMVRAAARAKLDRSSAQKH